MTHLTLRQLLPELDWKQRTKLGNHLHDILDIKIEEKVKEKQNFVRLYHEKTHDQIVIEAAKLFGNGRG